jgi:hypothetical protein
MVFKIQKSEKKLVLNRFVNTHDLMQILVRDFLLMRIHIEILVSGVNLT